MKKSIITVIAALCIFGASDVYAQGGYGYRPNNHRPNHSFYGRNGIELSVGYAHSNYRHKNFTDDLKEKDKGLHGLYVGVTKDFALVRRVFYFQTGLTYTYQNSSNRYDFSSLKIVSDRNEHYLDVPVKLKFAMDVIPNLRAFVSAGPTLNFGLSSKLYERCQLDGNKVGKYIYNYYNGKVKTNTFEHKPEVPASAYRAFDVDMGFALGAEIYDVAVVKFGFDWGLINKNKNKTVADYRITHRNTFSVGLGVRF